MKFLEEMMNDPRMSIRTRTNAAERLSQILLQSERVTEKRASRRDRIKLAVIEADENRPTQTDPVVANVLSSVVGGKA
jgi:uncharacterized protein (UPF0147 family)